MGDSHEEVGFNDGTRAEIMAEIARRAARAFPFLRSARIVRAWGALRVMTPDGMPIYDQSESSPGAFCAASHSGITLAATHTFDLPRWIAEGTLPPELNAFSAGRFGVH
jgi:glycine/D-amino acid oxidase-like deaminating enzyme